MENYNNEQDANFNPIKERIEDNLMRLFDEGLLGKLRNESREIDATITIPELRRIDRDYRTVASNVENDI